MGQQPLDVVFLSDTTGSMGGLISGVQSSSNAILSSLSERGAVEFGVGEYRDGNSDAFGFRYNVTDAGSPILTSDTSVVSSGIDLWSANGGGDFPEDNLFGLREVAENTPWRSDSRRFIFWFGDAPGLDPASDGTTLDATLQALNDNCVQVVALDLSSLDSTGQATAITSATLSCGEEGGSITSVPGGVLEDISDLSSIEDEIPAILAELFDEVILTVIMEDVNRRALLTSLRSSSIALSRSMTNDVGARLYRMRSSRLNETITRVVQGPSTHSAGAKGGLAKQAFTPVTTEYTRPWEVWGQVYYFSEEQDRQEGVVGTTPVVFNPGTNLQTFGGSIGIDYDLSPEFNIGLAFGAATSEADASGVSDIDIDGFSLTPYLSYYKRNALGAADLYADALFSFGFHDYETSRAGGINGDTEGNSYLLELNSGLNYQSGQLVHGPVVQFRYLDGEIDAYTENGGTAFPDVDYKSVATQLGYQASYPMPVAGGVVVPQLRAAWEHEFEADGSDIAGLNLGTVDEDLAVLGAGVFFYGDNGFRVGVDYEARLGDLAQSHYVGVTGGFSF